jgi:hypothetical protein
VVEINCGGCACETERAETGREKEKKKNKFLLEGKKKKSACVRCTRGGTDLLHRFLLDGHFERVGGRCAVAKPVAERTRERKKYFIKMMTKKKKKKKEFAWSA